MTNNSEFMNFDSRLFERLGLPAAVVGSVNVLIVMKELIQLTISKIGSTKVKIIRLWTWKMIQEDDTSHSYIKDMSLVSFEK